MTATNRQTNHQTSRHLNRHPKRHPHRPRAVLLGIAVALLSLLPLAPAGAATTSAGDPAGTAYTQPSVRAMTWNICGEAGGATPATSAYCPDRARPDLKARAVADIVSERNLNAVMFQEICSGSADDGYGNSASTPANPSDLEAISSALGAGWTFQWAKVQRPDGRSDCRGGLSGTLSVAIGVKGAIDWSHAVPLPVPLNRGADRAQVLCVAAAGWETRICTTHLANIDDAAVYTDELSTVHGEIANYPSVLLGGDFNTRSQANLQALYSTMAECDQQSYAPGDAAGEATHFTYQPVVPDPATGVISSGTYSAAKLDYLFSTAGFTGCDALTERADQADYSHGAQPHCDLVSSPTICTPTGVSDHAPLSGFTKGGPVLDWSLKDGHGGTAADASGNGNAGTLTSGVSWAADHAGSASFNGTGGAVTGHGPAVDTTKSFTVSAWAEVRPGAGTSVVLSQDGTTISGTMLWYDKGDGGWHFGMPRSDSTVWDVDQAVSTAPAEPGVWTRLTGVFDAAAGTLTLYVDGALAGTGHHTALWSATGPFAAGRDRVGAAANAFMNGGLQAVRAFDYPMTAAEVASYATGLAAPTATTTAPASSSGDPGCAAVGPYGVVPSATPALRAHVLAPDPSAQVRAEFSLWDDTDPSRQPITMGGPGSASGNATGGGTVSVTAPALIRGHLYGWYARTATVAGHSATTAVCHFYALAG
ncbi:LamG-like jellyroll fold domain-containing protein [Streptomyces sp. CA-111067]|uniref:LamG-like jellyroll fold domain-containing protein n=1 Tax=Streptomyces sp. CA-111067 TaxID=3240046 RepID=UPI003D964A88